MRKIVVSTFLSLDGVMQAPGGPEEDPTDGFQHGGWSVNYWDDYMGKVMDEAFSRPADLLLGRRTYEIFAAHWPHTDEPGADALNNARKYVATTTLETAEWQNTTLLKGDIVPQIRRLKEEDGREIQVHGSSDLIQTLLAHDLVDELQLWIFPLVLGKGKRLFGDGAIPAGLKLADAKTSTTGVVIATYRRSGDVEPGSFALEQTTAAEVERRRKLAGPTAHPSVAVLDALVGEWVGELDDPGKPGATVRTTVQYEWMEGGRFLLQLAPAPPPFPTGHSLIGRRDPDDEASPFVQHYFDSRGVARVYDMTFDGRTWTLERKADGDDDFDQRFRGTLSEDGKTITGAWERSDAPGQPIHHDFDVVYRKV